MVNKGMDLLNLKVDKEDKRKRTYVEDLERGIYDIKNQERYSYKSEKGLTEDIIREISKEKDEPQWMRDFRLKSLKIYNEIDVPTWGPDITDLDIDNIVTYVRPDTDMKGSWDEVPEDIKQTFDLLGIPKAERESLAGVGAQYDSEVVYHSVREDLTKQGVIYTDIETAMREHEDLVKEYFMKCVPPSDHKFAALHEQFGLAGPLYMFQKE